MNLSSQILRVIAEEQKHHLVEVSEDLFDRGDNGDTFLKNIITWRLKLSTMEKTDFSETQESTSVKIKCPGHGNCFLWLQRIPSTGSNGEWFYCPEVSRQLRESVRRKRPELWRNVEWMLHHDNSPVYSALVIRKKNYMMFLRNARTSLIWPLPTLYSCREVKG